MDPSYPVPSCDFVLDVADGASIRVNARSFGKQADGGKTPALLVCEQAHAHAVLAILRTAAG